MTKKITANQITGEIGENEVRGRFLTLGWQFDGRSRLEAGIDGIAEVMNEGQPMARMIAVQIKSTKEGKYTSETDSGFTYLLRPQDLAYWRGSNLPVVVVFFRQSDRSFYWKEVSRDADPGERRLNIDKAADVLDDSTVNKLAALTVPKTGLGYYVPPLGGGEDALVNILPITLPKEMYISSTPYTPAKAIAVMLDGDGPKRFDWVINGGIFWSFHDPRASLCANIVDGDQVEAVDTEDLALHDEVDEQNKFSYLLRQALRHQTDEDLGWNKDHKALYFRATETNMPRNFAYTSSKKKTDADVVSVFMDSKNKERVSFVRHHAFSPRFELMGDQWYLIVTPTYHFTTNGYYPHQFAAPLLSGKKRLDKSAALRGQVIMWHRFLTEGDRVAERNANDLFGGVEMAEAYLKFGEPPSIHLDIRVPEDGWVTEKKKEDPILDEGLFSDVI
ncbi:hypothetical protein LPB140_08895 [Sphingorhabdus lutea]|uniref:DUF4365 domain-containing protein n=1 Tax=Sphingorhabdus lutea TaxID=1913578 RepID=A0A1L3JCN1_9SPHN|nr:DUF4365 domain-containing protein [Sphingorhabdus lutea]APG62886.1 hypothetical protein LPB140_08895 [Sphingorhabdus lutea]